MQTYICGLKVFSKTNFNKCLAISSSDFHSGKSSLTLNIFPNKANHIDVDMFTHMQHEHTFTNTTHKYTLIIPEVLQAIKQSTYSL